jgi:2-phosphoglycerate kinase
MVWDPYGTLRQALWIGGAQWAGKSTVAMILARRHGVTVYRYDYQDARAHDDRRVARRVRLGEPPEGPDLETVWQNTTPEAAAATTLAGFAVRFEWVLDDQRALVSGRPIIAEGWGLRPELVMQIVDSARRMVVMVPTEEFRQHQLRSLPRAGASELFATVSDPERAQRNRVDRDRLIAEDVVRSARQYGVQVIEVDGSLDPERVADLVAEHFGPYLDQFGP